jgi:antitoxin component of RelBE/YafQ-DinJ toxin-antitoxin module
METKLTLKLDQKVINSAKKYAENNNLTLSQLVEDYFNNLLSEDTPKFEYPPLVKKLSGIISENDLRKLSQNDDRVKRILGEEV